MFVTHLTTSPQLHRVEGLALQFNCALATPTTSEAACSPTAAAAESSATGITLRRLKALARLRASFSVLALRVEILSVSPRLPLQRRPRLSGHRVRSLGNIRGAVGRILLGSRCIWFLDVVPASIVVRLPAAAGVPVDVSISAGIEIAAGTLTRDSTATCASSSHSAASGGSLHRTYGASCVGRVLRIR